MANGRNTINELAQLLTMTDPNTLEELTPEVRDSTRVIDLTKNKDLMRRLSGVDFGAGSAVPSALPRTQNQQLPGLGTPFTNQQMQQRGMTPPSNDPLTQMLANGGEPRTDEAEFFPQALGTASNRTVEGETLTNPEQILQDFVGRDIEGTTPRGVPEAEEISGLGKALSSFGKALETPGFQKFLGQMGIAFAQGQPDQPGTILGQAAIEEADSAREAQVMEQLLSGADPSEVDLEGLTRESLASIRELIGQQDQTRLAEEGLELSQQEIDLGYANLDVEQQQAIRQLDQYDRRLGQFDRQLDIQTLQALSDQIGGNKPEGVSASVHGRAIQTVASTRAFLDAAKENIQKQFGDIEGLQKIQQINAAMRGEDGAIDPMAVRGNLPPAMQQEFDRQVAELARSVERGFRNEFSTGGFDFNPGLPTVSSSDEVQSLSDGAIFQRPDGSMWLKRGNQVVPMNDAARTFLQSRQGGE